MVCAALVTPYPGNYSCVAGGQPFADIYIYIYMTIYLYIYIYSGIPNFFEREGVARFLESVRLCLLSISPINRVSDVARVSAARGEY